MKNSSKNNESDRTDRLFIGDSVMINTESHIAVKTGDNILGKTGVVMGFYSDEESISLTDKKTLIKVFIPDIPYRGDVRWWWNLTNFDITKVKSK